MTAGYTIAFLLFAVVAAITPGPSNLILASTGAAVGIVRGLPALFGQVVGMGVMLFLVAFGLGSLVLKNLFIVLGLKAKYGTNTCMSRLATPHSYNERSKRGQGIVRPLE